MAFVVIAAAAPMAAMVGNVPVALLYGNGPGLPAAFALSGVTLLCFCVGYAAMSRRVINTGAFYTYVARGFGKPPAVGAAYLAVLSYGVLTIGLAGAFGYFVHLGIGIPWEVGSAVAIAVVGVLGYRSAEVSAKVLGVLMTLEFGVLAVFDVAVGVRKGADALPLAALSPHNVFSGSIGIALMFAFTSFVGFESGALYGEETANPERSIPRATYIAVASVGIFYFLTTWFAVGSFGVANAHPAAVAAKASGGDDKLGNLLIDQGSSVVGSAFGQVMGVLLLTSVLASMLAVHNASSRYLFALGRERVLPGALGRYHGDHLSPYIGSLTVSTLTVVVVGAFAAGGLDPYLSLATSMVGLSTLGVVALQVLAAVSIIAFFRRRGERDWWRTVIFPGLGALGLGTAFVLAVVHFSTLVSTDNPVVVRLPWLLLVAIAAGVVTGLRLRRARPDVYARIARSRLRPRPRTLPRPAAWARRYALIGAGPAGLIAARALRAEGIPFDWYERQDDLGGIWNPEAPGSPMYDTAEFISSKHVSGFTGFPMPDEYPDYPSAAQIRAYIEDFATAEDLRPLVTFGTAVTHAVPVPSGGAPSWDVTLSTGETRRYAGIVAAPGVTWHPFAPAYPGQGSFRGEVRHSSTYRSPAEFAGKRVLVVGGGNSGVDIACDAAGTAAAAYLSVRRGYRYIPKHIWGVPTDALTAGVLDPPRGKAIPTDPEKLVDALAGDLTRFGLPAPDHALLTSHPILNSEVLDRLADGSLVTRPDVVGFTGSGVAFADGTSADVDLVILATGYTYALPFLDDGLLTWRGGRPDLYLNIFDRAHDGLAVLGFVEFADAAYRRFEEMARLIVLDITARELGGEVWESWSARKVSDRPNLRGGMAYVDSPRHANYVDSETYQVVLSDIRDRYGIGEPSGS